MMAYAVYNYAVYLFGAALNAFLLVLTVTSFVAIQRGLANAPGESRSGDRSHC
jgi:hypothetical protein